MFIIDTSLVKEENPDDPPDLVIGGELTQPLFA
jgi:hypothetical protein